MNKRWVVLLVTVLGLLVIDPTYAHHGSASYEGSKEVTVTGIVTSYNFTNPHVLISVDVKSASGSTEKWEGELDQPQPFGQSRLVQEYTQAWRSDYANGRSCKERGPNDDHPQSAEERRRNRAGG